MCCVQGLRHSLIVLASIVLVSTQFTFEDPSPSCTNKASTCVLLQRCLDREAIRNQICGFNNDIPLVCCVSIKNPPTRLPSYSSTEISSSVPDAPESTQSPIKNNTLPTDCGKSPSIFFNRIVGGEKVEASSWPWLVLLYTDGAAECGGSIISEQWILTASHCVYEGLTAERLVIPSRMKVRQGVTELSQTATFYGVSKIVPHPDYIGTRNYANDIALVKLHQSLHFTRTLTPVCLPGSPGDTQQDVTDRMAFIAGWGKTNQDDRSGSNVLLQAQVPIWSENNCMQVYRKIFPITRTSFCAGTKDGSKDACQGDSGGPLMLPGLNKYQDRFYCVGIVSFGYGCGRPGYPGGYTNVSLYRQWIEKQISL